jgi:hypothetical protein
MNKLKSNGPLAFIGRVGCRLGSKTEELGVSIRIRLVHGADIGDGQQDCEWGLCAHEVIQRFTTLIPFAIELWWGREGAVIGGGK